MAWREGIVESPPNAPKQASEQVNHERSRIVLLLPLQTQSRRVRFEQEVMCRRRRQMLSACQLSQKPRNAKTLVGGADILLTICLSFRRPPIWKRRQFSSNASLAEPQCGFQIRGCGSNSVPLLEVHASSEIENIVTTSDRLFQFRNAEDHADPSTQEAMQ